MSDKLPKDSDKKKAGRKARKKVAGAAVAFTAAVGVFFSSLFGSPNDLLVDPAAEPPAVVMEINTEEGSAEEQEMEEDKKSKPGFFARIRMMILKLPLYIRVAIGIPLWALGWLLTQAFSSLWKLLLAPVFEQILTFLIMALILLIVMTVLIKTVFPDLPLKEILSRPNIMIVLLACAVFCVFNIVMREFNPDFARLEGVFRFGEGLVILLIILLRMSAYKRRHAAAK